MLRLSFEGTGNRSRRILCLGAHSDDIEIGCGGAILKLSREFPEPEVYWIVFGSTESRAREAEISAGLFLRDCKKKKVVVKDFKDGYFPYIGGAIKDFLEQLKLEFSPDLVFTHYRDDR